MCDCSMTDIHFLHIYQRCTHSHIVHTTLYTCNRSFPPHFSTYTPTHTPTHTPIHTHLHTPTPPHTQLEQQLLTGTPPVPPRSMSDIQTKEVPPQQSAGQHSTGQYPIQEQHTIQQQHTVQEQQTLMPSSRGGGGGVASGVQGGSGAITGSAAAAGGSTSAESHEPVCVFVCVHVCVCAGGMRVHLLVYFLYNMYVYCCSMQNVLHVVSKYA